MSAFNRKAVRQQFAGLLSTALTGASLAQSVLRYLPATLGNKSPVVAVAGGGSERERAHLGANTWRTWVYLQVTVFVLYSEDSAGTWTREKAEDRLDDIEAAICDVVMANKTLASYWDALYFDGPSAIDGPLPISGVPYVVETYRVKARVING